MKTYEFEMTVTVRKRLRFSGPADATTAKTRLEEAINGGMSVGTFAKRGRDGHAIETLVDKFKLEFISEEGENQ